MILSCRVLSNIVILSRCVLYHYVGEVTHQEIEFSIKLTRTMTLQTFLSSSHFCNLLNNLDSDQDQHYVGPDLDPNSVTLRS